MSKDSCRGCPALQITRTFGGVDMECTKYFKELARSGDMLLEDYIVYPCEECILSQENEANAKLLVQRKFAGQPWMLEDDFGTYVCIEQRCYLLAPRLNPGMKVMDRKCPSCGGDLVIRINHTTKAAFVGCSNYPQCRHSYDL